MIAVTQPAGFDVGALHNDIDIDIDMGTFRRLKQRLRAAGGGVTVVSFSGVAFYGCSALSILVRQQNAGGPP